MKLFKRLFIVIGIIILIILLILGIVVALIYDNSYKDNKYKEYSNDLNYEVNSIASNALKDTKETKIVDASLSEDEINYLLQALTNTLNETFKDKMTIRGANLEIDENANMQASIHFKVLGFPSSLKGGFTFKDDGDNIYLQINNASVGKLNAKRGLISTLAKGVLNEDDIKEDLDKKGIIIDLDLQNLKVSINKDQASETVLNMMKDDPNKDLYACLVDIIFENELIKIISSNHELGLDAHLEKLAYDSSTFYDIPYSFDYDKVKTDVESLLDNNIIDYKNCGLTFDYLVRGWKNVSKKDEEGKYDFIKELNLSSIGIYSNTTYDGILEVPQKSMLEIISEQSPSIHDLLSPSLDIKIYEDDFTNILFSTGAIGISYAFSRIENDKHKISYLYLESIYAKISDDKLEIIITININGYQIALKCVANASGSDGLQISTDVTSVVLGEINLKDDQISAILNFLNEALKDEEWIGADSINKKINFNFTKLLTDSPVFNALVEKSSSTEVGLYSSSTKGYIKISLSGLL